MTIEYVEDHKKTNDREVPMVEEQESNWHLAMNVHEIYAKDLPFLHKHLDVD